MIRRQNLGVLLAGVVCVAISAMAQTGPVVVWDNFNRANGALGSATTGQTWTVHNSSPTIESNQARLSTGFTFASLDSGLSNGTVEIKVPVVDYEFWLNVRMQDPANYWRFGRAGSGNYLLQQVKQNAIGSPVIEILAAVTPANNDVLSCAMSAAGITCSVNGVPVARTADTFGSTSTRVGFSGNYSPSLRFDDLQVFQPSPTPDLTVSITGPASVYTGGSAIWTTTLRNVGGGTAVSAQVRITPPAGHPTLVIEGAYCSNTGGQYVCTAGDLAANGVLNLTVRLLIVGQVSSLMLAANAPAVAGETDTALNNASFVTLVRPSIPANALISDTFDRPDANALGTSSSGHLWTEHQQAFLIRSQLAQSGSGFSLTSIDSGVAAQRTYVVLSAPGPEFWMLVRFQDGSNYWRFGRWQNQAYQLQQVTGGGLGSPTVTTLATVSASAGDLMMCDNTASQIECSVNGVAVVRAVNTIGNTATRVGIGTYQSSGVSFDDFYVTGQPAVPDLVTTLTGPASAPANTLTSWTATLRNTSSVTVNSAELNFTAPGVSGTPTFVGATCAVNGSGWRCPVGTLVSNQQVTVRMDAITPASGTVIVTAAAPAAPGETQQTNNTASVTTAVQAAPPANTLVFDDFNRSDAATLGTAPTGQTWIAQFGSISLNAQQAFPGSGYVLARVDTGSAVNKPSVRVTALANEFFLVFRFQDGNNYWRFGRSGGAYMLQQVLNGALGAPPVTTLATVNPAVGDTLACDNNATQIDCSVNGVAVATSASTAGNTGTSAGFSAYQSSTVRFDDFVVTAPPPAPDVAVSLTGPTSAYAGTATTWTATVRNQGSVSASNVELNLTLSGTGTPAFSGATCSANGGGWRCVIGTLAAAQVVNVSILATPPAAGSATLSASSPAVSGEVATANNSAAFSTSLNPALPADTVVVDTFDRSDSPVLGITNTGQAWTQHGDAVGIQSNRAAPGSGYVLATVDGGLAANKVSLTLATAGSEGWLVVRYQDQLNYWRFGQQSGTAYKLQQVANGNLGTAVVTTLASVIPAPNDALVCENTYSQLECKVNGVAVARTTDTSGTATTRAGISSYSSGTTRFDNFAISQAPAVPDLGVTVGGPASIRAGVASTWTSTIRNVGSVAISNVELNITVTSLTSPTFSGATCVVNGSSRRCTIGTLTAGQAVTVTIQGSATAPGTVSLTGSTPVVSGETLTANNSATMSTSVLPAIPANAVVTDTFDRADANALGNSTSGQLWSEHQTAFLIRSQQARSNNGFSLSSIDSGIAANRTYVTLATPGTEFWMLVRFQDASNYWRFGRLSNQAYQLQQVVNNALGAPAVTALATVNPAAGDVIMCESISSQLECSVNGVAVVRTLSTAGNTMTRVGLGTYQSPNVNFDDFYVTPPPAAPDLAVSITGPASGYAGMSTTWTATVRNQGTLSASNAEMNLTLSGTGTPTLSGSGAACSVNGGGWRCLIGTMTPGQVVNVSIVATPPAAGTATVNASSPAVSGELSLGNNSATFQTTLGAPLPADAVVVDTFDRPDSGVLGSATTGHLWTLHNGSFSILSNRAAPGTNYSLATVDGGLAAYKASVTLSTPGTEAWLVIRFQDSANYWRFGHTAGQPYRLQQILNNAIGSPVITTLASVTPAANDALLCENTYGQLECKVNNVAVARTSDPSGTSTTRAGMSSNSSAASRFDTFAISQPPPIPELGVTVSGPSSTRVGTATSWTSTIRNLSSVSIPNVELNITVTSLPSATYSGATCVVNGGSQRCTIGTMTAGQAVTVTIQGTPATPGVISLTASAPVVSGETVSANNTAAMNTTVGAQIPANATVVDTFDRADANSLGTSTSGHVWTEHQQAITIRSQLAAPTSGFSLSTVNSGTAVYGANVMVATPATEFWLIVRFQDGANYWRFGRNNSNYVLQLVKNNALAAPVLQTFATVNPSAGDQVVCNNTTSGLTCSVNGQQVVATTDASFQGTTRVGLSSNSSAALRWDDFFVTGPPQAPNIAVTVGTSRYGALGGAYPVDVTARNTGTVDAGSGTLNISLPGSVTVSSKPANCTQSGTNVSCPIGALAPNAAVMFPLLLIPNTGATVNGTATAVVPGDQFSLDDTAFWTNAILPSGSVIESFERPNTASGLGITPSQHIWTTGVGGFRILNSTAQADASGAMSYITTSYSFGTLETTLGSNPLTTRILFRVANASNYYYLSANASGQYAVTKVVNGVASPPQFMSIRQTVAVSAGDVIRIINRPDDGFFVAVNGIHSLDGGDIVGMYEKGWGVASSGGPANISDFFVSPRMVSLDTVENFSYPDGYPLIEPNVGTQYNWRQWLGPQWVHQGAQARPVSSGYTYTWLESSSEQPKVEVKVTNQGQGAWLMFRFNELDSTYFRFGQNNDGVYRVQFMQNDVVGAFPVALQTLASPTPANNDVLRVEQKSDGTVECLVNGVVTHRFVDTTTNFRWTANGMAAANSNTAFDDFKFWVTVL